MIKWSTFTVSVISFVLGLISSFIVQWWNDRNKRIRIKGAIELHLKEIILEECEQLRKDYERIIIAIQTRNRHDLAFKAFERFDAEIYKANNPSDYYKIYGTQKKGKFEKLVSIYAIISFLKENLPFNLYTGYTSEVNTHMSEALERGENKFVHFETCNRCDIIRNNHKATAELRLNEIDNLKKLINELLVC